MGVVKLQPGDISIVENAGTFLLWYDTRPSLPLTNELQGSTIFRISSRALAWGGSGLVAEP